MLPLVIFAALAGGALTPALFRKDALGFGMSLAAAFVASAALTTIMTGLARDRRSG
jgi:hypothetical protein